MPNCSSCTNAATVEYVGAGKPLPYCDKHLPSFARRASYAHLVIPAVDKPVVIPAPEVLAEEVVESPAPKSLKKSTKVETPSEAPAEETSQTAPEEEPKQ